MKSLFFNDDYDPYEQEREKDMSGWIVYFVLEIGLLCSRYTRLYVLLFWFLGCLVVFLRAYLTSLRGEGNQKTILFREIGCAWKSGNLSMDVIMFWPFDLLILLFQCLFGFDISFSRSYQLAKFSAYNSGRGKYYGMHTDTACECAENAVQMAQEDAVAVFDKIEQTGKSAKKQSRSALVYASIIGFLTLPLNWFRDNEEDTKNSISISAVIKSTQKEFFEIKALVDNLFGSLVKLFKRFFIFLATVISFHQKILPIRKILWYLMPPIRGIPIEWLRRINPIRAPSINVLVNSLNTRTLNLGGCHEKNSKIYWGSYSSSACLCAG